MVAIDPVRRPTVSFPHGGRVAIKEAAAAFSARDYPRRCSDAVWIVAAFALIGAAVGCWIAGSLLTAATLAPVALVSALLLALGKSLRFRGWERAACLSCLQAQMLIAGWALTVLSFIVAAANRPLQDEALLSFGRALGVQWPAFAQAHLGDPWMSLALQVAYASLPGQTLLLLPLLVAIRRERTAGHFVLAWSLTLGAAVLISAFVPAVGGYVHYAIGPEQVSGMRIPVAWRFLAQFEAARAGQAFLVNPLDFDGIITFPSFHAAAAVLLAWFCWGIPFLRWPALALNVLMWVSAVPVGGHYIADVLAGTAIAGAAIALTRERVRRSPARAGAGAPLVLPSHPQAGSGAV